MKPGLALRPRARRASREPVVPMINVVFLLLIFFLMTAQIVPPAPVDLTLPRAAGDEDRGETALYVTAAGEIAFQSFRGDEALAAAAAQHASGQPLRLHADARLPAATLARLLGQLATLGLREIEIVTEGG